MPYRSAPQPDAATLIEIVEQAMHASPAEWLFFRKLRVGLAGRRLQLRPGEGDIRHDHGLCALARHSRTDMAAARGHVTKPMSAVFRSRRDRFNKG